MLEIVNGVTSTVLDVEKLVGGQKNLEPDSSLTFEVKWMGLEDSKYKAIESFGIIGVRIIKEYIQIELKLMVTKFKRKLKICSFDRGRV
jgi:hypothetical protein